ncbi:oxidoreductase [Pseudomonas sp. UL073]|uniref:Oxidoreductase n=1 Tax=Zestomonas insulae TaxID=2809017 RepID=A0ABS2IFW3_9GAMM|nr:PDR/VanB family oxidoreductase [Pseudomonas insulae]MBM7061043.1 oxidoreductase [Pseudomonas insulae]
MSDLTLRISAINAEAKDILSFELVSIDGQNLPPFEPGAHLEVHLANGLKRHYSLSNDCEERDRYVIGVSLAPASRGGSRFLHGGLQVGDNIRTSLPRNHFPLIKNGERYDFIAGGIGITPILAMVRWCEANGKEWYLHYLARNRLRAAFYEELQQLSPTRVKYHFLDEHDGQPLDVEKTLMGIPQHSHIYCCGPGPLMERVKAGTDNRPAEHAHFEWFSAAPQVAADLTTGFTLIARRSGITVNVSPEQSILEALESNGLCVPFSCREGLCSSCETRVLAGIPEHRDFVLSESQKASNQTMLICVSRSKSEVLELDV